mmetsp:Transcript_23934/g.42396  ORF Transcript_23934/g.42396 Transcript_23934/m.42396 type:complete len:139 (-) Transcript_23934:159-575(-)
MHSIPRIAINIEAIVHENTRFIAWDICESKAIRTLWHNYYRGAEALVFAVDADERDRIEDAREKLPSMLSEEGMRGAILLVFVNKIDIPNSMSVDEVSQKLNLHEFTMRSWSIKGCSAKTGEGLDEGFNWVRSSLKLS